MTNSYSSWLQHHHGMMPLELLATDAHQGFFFNSAFCSVLALGVDLGTRFGSGFWLRPAANMTCLALASDSM
jgi:hypothetical protein